MTIKGLTTAAGLWTTGIIGVAVGSGFYEGGLLGTVLVLLAETYFVKVRGKIQKTPQFTVHLGYDDKNALDQVLRYCKNKRMSIVNLKIRSHEELTEGKYAADILVRGNVPGSELVGMIRQMPGVVSVEDLKTAENGEFPLGKCGRIKQSSSLDCKGAHRIWNRRNSTAGSAPW